MQFTSNSSYNKRSGISSVPKTKVSNLNMMKFKGSKPVVPVKAPAPPAPVKAPAPPAPVKAPAPPAPVKAPAPPAPVKAAPKKSVNFEDLNKELDQNIKTIKTEEKTVKRQTRNMLPKKKRSVCGCGRR